MIEEFSRESNSVYVGSDGKDSANNGQLLDAQLMETMQAHPCTQMTLQHQMNQSQNGKYLTQRR